MRWFGANRRRIGASVAVLMPAALLALGGAMKGILSTGSLVAGLLAFGHGAEVAAEVAKLPPSGTTHFTTYFSVRTLSDLKMVEDSSMSAAELVGITRNPDGEPYFDNMVVRCLVNIRTVKSQQELYGACKETDNDGG